MGLFSRSSDPDGFYTGDAPASVPGFDGAEPTAYQSRAASVAPAPADPSYSSGPSSYPQSTASSGYQPPPAATYPPPGTFPPPGPPGPPGPPPTSGGSASHRPPRARSRARQANPWQANPWQANPWQAGPRQLQSSVALATSAISRTVRWVVFGVMVAVLIPIGFTVYRAFDTWRDVTTQQQPEPPVTATGSLGVPVAVGFRSADLQVTVRSAVAQPVDGWSSSSSAPDPKLVVAVTVQRTDIDSGTVSVMPWDWEFRPAEGPAAKGELISAYQPEVESDGLTTGQSTSGLVTFDIGADTGTLVLTDPFRREQPVAQWPITATAPKVVTGAVGKPVTGQVGGPGFTVTLTKPSWIPAGDDRLRSEPDSGTVLRVALTVTGLRKGYAGQIQAGNVWFVPRGGKPIQARYPGHLTQSSVLVSVSDTSPRQLVVGFDLKRTPGVLELRENAGKVVIRWPVG